MIHVIDSHTGGEPTRIVIEGGPDLGGGSMRQRRDRLVRDFDDFRSSVVNEPRGWDAMVGGLLCESSDPSCTAGIIFFNNVGPINMCVHGTIGLMVTLAHLGRLSAGSHRIETPVGVVSAELLDECQVRVTNVPSYRWRENVPVELDDGTSIRGDIAWGGNWFYLIERHNLRLELSNVEQLVDFCWQVRCGLTRQGITGQGQQEIDHIELFVPSRSPDADSDNFVLCPGKAYDRSPCGTGTSAKLACLHAEGLLRPGQSWRQRGIVGSIFTGSIELDESSEEGRVIPSVTGSAYVTADCRLLLNPQDPFCRGIPTTIAKRSSSAR